MKNIKFAQNYWLMKTFGTFLKNTFKRANRMQLITIIVAAIAVCGIVWFLVKGSQRSELVEGDEFFASPGERVGGHSVLVIHSWGKEYVDDNHYHKMFVDEFEKNGVKVNMRHLFINAKHNTLASYELNDFPHMRDFVERKWKPELIIICDDPAMEWLTTYHKNDNLFTKTPIVFSGVSVLQKDTLKQYFPLATGFQDTIALAENIEIIKEVRGDRCVAININGSNHDKTLRADICHQIDNNDKIIDNSDFHLSALEVSERTRLKNDTFVVAFVSSSDPGLNCPSGDYKEGHDRLVELYRGADKNSQLQISYSLYSNTLIDRSSRPQFSAICEQFGTKGRPRILCGYFASIETEIIDKAIYGSKILTGTKPSDLPIAHHKKGYYMDYNALKRIYSGEALQTKYEEFSQKYTFVNTPYEVAHPIMSKLLPVTGLVLALAILIGIIIAVTNWRRRTLDKQQEIAKLKYRQRMKLFSLAHATTWILKRDLNVVHITYATYRDKSSEAFDVPIPEVFQILHPKSRPDFEKCLNSISKRGNYSVRLLFTLDGGQTYVWRQLSYMITAEAQQKNEFMGVLIDINKTVEIEQQLEAAYALANELKMKEEFLINFDTSIFGNAEILTEAASKIAKDDGTLSQQQKTELSNTIHEKTEELLHKLNEAIGKAETTKQTPSGDFDTTYSGSTEPQDSQTKSSDDNQSSFTNAGRAITTIITLLLIMACTWGLTSCQKREDMIYKKVLVVHSYGYQLPDYVKFDSLLQQEILKYNIKADIKNLYIGYADPTTTGNAECQIMADSLKRLNWEPDLVVVEGDAAVEAINLDCNKTLFPYINTKPIVYGGLYVPDWKNLRSDHNSIIYCAPIDFLYNIGIATSLSKQNVVEIELDDMPRDSVLRHSLRETICHSPFVDNTDFHEHRLSSQDLKTLFKDSILIITLSAKDHKQNVCSNPEHASLFEENVRSIYTFSSRYANLVVKKDLYAYSIVDKTGKPEFTAVREGFDDGENKFLAGYFASYETIAADIANSVNQLLRGQETNAVGIYNHHQQSYMNYNAMVQQGLDYDDYKQQYEIIGVPYKVSHPTMHWLLLIGGALVVLLIIGIISYFVIGRYFYHIYKLQKQISDEQQVSTMALEGIDHLPILSASDLEHLLPNIHPDYEDVKQQIGLSLTEPGTYEFEMPIKFDNKSEYEWWKIFYIIELENKDALSYDGIMLSTVQEHLKIDELNKAIALAEESRAKENFLNKLRHEMHTPLNIILGSCDILSGTFSAEITPEERQEYANGILQNSMALCMMINDIITYTQIDRNRLQINMQAIRASSFVSNCLNESLVIVPKHLKVRLAKGADDLFFSADARLLSNIMQQLVSNACKYTDVGGIAMGWQQHIATQEVELFVQDTGRGIAADKQSAIFEMFWKGDGFVPGLGVGLHIVKLLVDEMGGRISVDSQPHKGTRISVYFKMTDDRPEVTDDIDEMSELEDYDTENSPNTTENHDTEPLPSLFD